MSGNYGLYVVAMYKDIETGDVLGYDVADTYAQRLVRVNPPEFIVKFRTFCKSFETMYGCRFTATNVEVDYKSVRFKKLNPTKRKVHYAKLEQGNVKKYLYVTVTGYSLTTGTVNFVAENKHGELVVGNSVSVYELCGKLETPLDDFRLFNGYVEMLNGNAKLIVYSGYGRMTVLYTSRVSRDQLYNKIGLGFDIIGVHQHGGAVKIDKIKGSECADTKLIIPEGVVGVKRFEFIRPTEVIIPISMKEISETSFAGETALDGSALNPGILGRVLNGVVCNVKTVRLSEACNVIGYKAFAYSPLHDINLSEHVKLIDTGAFLGCRNLKIDLRLIDAEIKSYAFKDSGIESIELISDGDIATSTFEGCENLERVTLEGTERIGLKAFYRCGRLLNLRLPDTVKRISALAFGRTDLDMVRIPKNCLSVAESAFDGCRRLRKIYIGRNTEIERSKTKEEHLLTSLRLQVQYNCEIVRY